MTQSELKELVEYRDGKLYWRKITSNRVKIGDEVGSIQSNGYRGCRIRNRYWGIHQLVFLYHYGKLPTGVIDHIDRNRLNNHISNLRDVSQQQNTLNKSNVKGYVKVGDKFRARITIDGVVYVIGTYKTPEAATNAYNIVKPMLHRFSGKSVTKDEIRAEIRKVRPPLPSNNTSGYLGVRKRYNGRWQATVQEDGRKKSLGHYTTAEEAHKVRQQYIKMKE